MGLLFIQRGRTMAEVPLHIAEGLRNIRSGLHCRWNPTCRYIPGSGFDAYGVIKDAGYEPRWEVWDQDAEGKDYRVMRVEGPGNVFLPLDDWIVQHIRERSPERWGGDAQKMLTALVDEPNERKQKLAADASRDLHEMVARWWWDCGAPKSGPGITFRGQRFRSAGAPPARTH
jgi:hypothetical protein